MKDHCLRPVMFLCLLCIIKVRFKLHFPKHSCQRQGFYNGKLNLVNIPEAFPAALC